MIKTLFLLSYIRIIQNYSITDYEMSKSKRPRDLVHRGSSLAIKCTMKGFSKIIHLKVTF